MERVPRGFQTAVDVEHGPRMHSRAAVCSNIIQVFHDKKWSCDHFRDFFMMGNLSGFMEI